jgi:glycosyltransferase involved in cell wall biosynthesis
MLADLLRDDAARGRLGAANRARIAAHFQPDACVDAYDALLRELVRR